MPEVSYERMLGHIQHHKIREWLLAGARKEDANTIRQAIERLSDGELNRRIARMLVKDTT